MRRHLLLVFAFPMLCLLALDAPTGSSEKPTVKPELRWLRGSDQEKFAMIERQFSGTYISMARVSYRYNELFFAGLDENWEFAKYQIEKIRMELESAFIRRPKRGETAGPFMNESLPTLEKAIEARDQRMFLLRFEWLTTACNACHAAQEMTFIEVHQPTHRRSPVFYYHGRLREPATQPAPDSGGDLP